MWMCEMWMYFYILRECWQVSVLAPGCDVQLKLLDKFRGPWSEVFQQCQSTLADPGRIVWAMGSWRNIQIRNTCFIISEDLWLDFEIFDRRFKIVRMCCWLWQVFTHCTAHMTCSAFLLLGLLLQYSNLSVICGFLSCLARSTTKWLLQSVHQVDVISWMLKSWWHVLLADSRRSLKLKLSMYWLVDTWNYIGVHFSALSCTSLFSQLPVVE